MKEFFKKSLIVLILFNFSTSINADIPHYLDFKYILNESVAGKKAQTALKNKLDKGFKSLKDKEKKLQAEEKKIIEQKKLIKPEEYKSKVENLRKSVSSLQKERNKLLKDIADQRSKARGTLLKNLNPIIKEYMQEKKIRMVVDKKNLIIL